MVSSINSTSYSGLNGQLSATDLYARVSKSLLSQNASVQKLGNAIAADQTKLSGLGQLTSALSAFQAFTQSVSGSGLETAATAGTPTVLDALTKTGAKAGSYQVAVSQLAQAQQLTSRAQTSHTAAIGSGASTTVQIELGTASGSSFTPSASTKITIDASNNSLDGIAKALTAAGVDASVVKNGNGYSLQLNGQSGAANSLRVSVGGDATLQRLLSYAPSSAGGLTQNSAAQDAKLTIDGKAVTSASNVVTGQIDGTALSLKTVGSSSVVVGQDNSAIAKNVANFASAYNSLVGKLATLGSGDLKSNAAVGKVQNQLAQLIKGNAGLAKAGVTIGADGTLQVDSKALNAAVAADPTATAALFTNGGTGVADQLSSTIGQLIGNTGLVGTAAQAATQDAATLTSQQTSLTKALATRANALVAQYTAALADSQSSSLLSDMSTDQGSDLNGNPLTDPSSPLNNGLTSTTPANTPPISLFDMLA